MIKNLRSYVKENITENINSDYLATVEDSIKLYNSTKIDSLAPSIGSIHGICKTSPKLDFDRTKEISKSLNIPLVLHGGSGSGEDNLRRCSTEGISKINIFTDFISAASDAVAANEKIKNWFDLLHTADEGIKKTLRYYYNLFDVNK